MPRDQTGRNLPECLMQLGQRVRAALKREGEIPLSSILRQTRIERGWSQQKLAFHLAICTDTISRLERGHRVPQPELEKKIREWIATPRKKTLINS